MPYTLTVGFIWFGLSAVIGLVVGWVLRSASASRQVSRARKQVQHDLEQEMAELRERATTLGRVAEERDALQAEVESMKARLMAPVTEVDNTDDATRTDDGSDEPRSDGVDDEPHMQSQQELSVEESIDSRPDVALGSAVLGRRLVQDDLKAVVGIGPAIEGLCHGVGIRTWWDLARAEPETLRSMLADAGARYARHDPSTWSAQAKRFAEGRWDEARTFEASLAAERNQ
ncbi:MAG: hypothetical protein ACO3HT_00350 [Ilumatobacteraceae bacterium]